ncbi:MAG TPA: hypothetical protein P5186_17280 [Candidatus Paceibacterota bacterium]|nr:hypothetical protein [Verrucomicrobiota bacterium]HRY49804.1 hypothetical protein [Candidatus Paceibacterota bacterium]
MGKVTATPPHLCNILRLSENARDLWQFNLTGANENLAAENQSLASTPLPAALVAKTWRSLWQRKLNVAWLPADQVYLRVVQLPACDPNELQSMVELQLEKLSPIPVAQVVWSLEVVPTATRPAAPPPTPETGSDTAPATPPSMQTVIVVIVARNLVEAFLGQLENQGYQADRIEFPALHQLLTLPVEADSIWIYPKIVEGKNTFLAAWWTRGVLQYIALLTLPSDPRWSACLTDHLSQMAWSGEAEGWLGSKLECHLVADPETAAVWEPVLNEWLGEAPRVMPPLPARDLASLSARRLMKRESRVNLMPGEYTARYRQQYTDRLWMRGLGAVVVLYLIGVLVYLGALEVLKYQYNRVQKHVKALTPDYQKVLQLRAKVQVYQLRQDLKYTALDCWRVVSELLPEELTLESLSFQRGKLVVSGMVPADQVTKVNEFNQAMIGATSEGRRVFSKVGSPNSQTGAGGQTYSWNFSCDLPVTEIE